MGGDEVKMHIGMGFEPAVLFGLVGVEIVHDEDDLLGIGIQFIDEFPKMAETGSA